MGLELAEQLGWRLPDVILYPTGGGTGLIGMWKAFQELRELGWLQRGQAAAPDQLPERRLCPDRARVRSRRALRRAVPQRPHRRQRLARAGGGRRFHDARRHSRQRRLAVAGRETRIVDWMRRVTSLEGIGICPGDGGLLRLPGVPAQRGTDSGRPTKWWSSTPAPLRSIRKWCRSTCPPSTRINRSITRNFVQHLEMTTPVSILRACPLSLPSPVYSRERGWG